MRHESATDRPANNTRQTQTRADLLDIRCEWVLGQIADGVIITDPSGEIAFSNESARHILGLKRISRRGAPGKEPSDVVDFLGPEGKADRRILAELTRAVQAGQPIIDAEARIRRPDGTEATIRGNATPVVSDDGQILGTVFTFRDVTAQRELDQRKNEFVATIAHHLRTPLTVVKGQAQYLERRITHARPLDANALLTHLAKIDQTTAIMATMIDSLVEMSRVPAPAPPRPFSFPPLPLRHAGQELSAAGQIARAAADECDSTQIAEAIVKQCRRLVGSAAAVWEADLACQELRLLAFDSEREVSGRTLARIAVERFSAASFAAQAARTGEPVGVPDIVSFGPSLAFGRETFIREGFRAAYSQPMYARGHLVGVLTVGYVLPHDFSAEERDSIRSLAELGALSLDHARLAAEARDAREQAAKMATWLDAIQSAAPVGIGFLDRDLRYLWVNRKLADTNGVEVDRHLGRTIQEVLPQFAPLVVPKLRQVLETGRPVSNWETRANRSPSPLDDTYLLIHYFPVRGPDQAVIGVGAMVQDISERKRAEFALRASEESFKRAQQIAHVGSWERDLASGRLRWSDEVYRIFGVDPTTFEATFPAFLACVHPADRELVQQALNAALRDHAPYDIEHRILRPDGSLRYVHERAEVIQNEEGKPICLAGTVQDVTERRQLEEATTTILAREQRERENWYSVIGHDLRQPVTVIFGYANLLANRLRQRGEPEEMKAVSYILTAAQNLNRLIGDLLDVSRIDQRRFTITPSPTDLTSLVRSVAERTAATMPEHPLRLTVSETIPPVLADPARIEQVLVNLLTNAAKYGYEATPIDVTISRENGAAHIVVTNRGEGIAPEELPLLFGRFHRTRRAIEMKAVGLGLGLYIAKGLIEAHGGRIWAESTPGERTAFHFTVPVLDATTTKPDNKARSLG
jgi:PAS domain S-box-containing protein